MDWHPDGTLIGFTMTSARSSADAYSYEPATGKVERWTFSETGGLNAATFVEPELVTWKAFDGKEISGFLYRPPASKFPGKRPVVVDIHGGPEGQERPGYMGRDNYLINELGVAFLEPNVRGSTGYGKTFVEARQRLPARELLQGHRVALRLDRHAARPRRGPDHGRRAAATAAT